MPRVKTAIERANLCLLSCSTCWLEPSFRTNGVRWDIWAIDCWLENVDNEATDTILTTLKTVSQPTTLPFFLLATLFGNGNFSETGLSVMEVEEARQTDRNIY
ncbi:hypothetical protein [Leptothermofonsia sp. ETS-13]|uniref:hypothetical protein n=1 Tax=Leptothermofonsia sp. ETS-13 TaxID=3035696 RepID=UPI003B9E165A